MSDDEVPQNGLTIKHLRLKDGQKQSDLATQVGITQSALSHIETGAHPASDLVLNRIARALCVPVAALVRDPRHAERIADISPVRRAS